MRRLSSKPEKTHAEILERYSFDVKAWFHTASVAMNAAFDQSKKALSPAVHVLVESSIPTSP